MPKALGKTVGRIAGALLALLAIGLAAPSGARAACSSHVLSQSDRDRAADLDPLVSGEDGRDAHPAPSPPPGSPRPCSGAFCSGEPGTPPVPPTWVGTPAKPSACLSPATSPPDGGLVGILADDGDLRPVHEGGSVFHPPRTPSPHAA